MQVIRIFLASSNELKRERELFEIEIYRKCKAWLKKSIFLHLDIWEDLSARMMEDGSQNEYNKFVKHADLVVVLAHTKVGAYTELEFDTAFGQFGETKKPFVYTYFKEVESKVEPSLQAFKDKLSSLKHFYSPFKDSDDLWNQFNKELDRLDENKFTKRDTTRKASDKVTSIIDSKNVVKDVSIGKLKGGFRVGDG